MPSSSSRRAAPPASAASTSPSPKGKGKVRTYAEQAQRVAAHTAHEVRIIGGQWKRSVLPVSVAGGLRPTPSRVRETLFNWLGQDMQGWRVLDAFAGTGALGLEAASRGAEQVVLVERDASLVRSLQATQARLGAQQVQVLQGNALIWMTQGPQRERFDLVFLDPPFESGDFLPALRAAVNCVPPGGWIYLESPCRFDGTAEPLPEGLSLHRHGQAGLVHFHLFQRQAQG